MPAVAAGMDVGCAEERRDTIVLQVIFALQNIVENAEPAADAGLSVSEDVVGEAETGRPIIFIWKIHAPRSARVTRKNDAVGSVDEFLRLQPWNEGKGTSFSVIFRLGIFIANAQGQSQAFAEMPGILRESGVLVGANIRRRFGVLEIFIGQSHEEIGKIGSRADRGGWSVKIILASNVIIVRRVVLIRREVKTELPIVVSFNPREIVVKSAGGVVFDSGTLRAETGVEV